MHNADINQQTKLIENCLEEAFNEVKDVIKWHMSNDNMQSERWYLDLGIKEFKLNYRRICGNEDATLTVQEFKALKIEEQMQEFVSRYLYSSNKKKIVKKILTVSANAYIQKALENSGLLYQIEYQAYRAKITVKLSTRHKIIFYITYSKMAKDLPKALSSIETLRTTLEQFGSGVTVKLNNGCERWE